MQSPGRPSVEEIFKKLDPSGSGMLTKQGVKEALAQLGMDCSEAAVDQIFRTAASDMTSPKTFGNLVGKLKQQKASNDASASALMKQRYDMEMAEERRKHQQEMDSLARQKDAQAHAMAVALGSPAHSSPLSNALVASSNHNRGRPPRSSPGGGGGGGGGGYKLVTRGSTPTRGSSYGRNGVDPSPTGFMSPVTYNRKFNQLVSDMEVQTRCAVDEALRAQRDRHADALERVVADKEKEMSLRLHDLRSQLERSAAAELNAKLGHAAKQAEEGRLSLLAHESAKMDELLGDAELFKIATEAELSETAEKFKATLASQLEAQRQAHEEELRLKVLEAEAKAQELRVAVIQEKDKHFSAEKEALEARLRAEAAAAAELALKRSEVELAESLEAQRALLSSEHGSEKEGLVLDHARAATAKLENVEAALRLRHTEALHAALDEAKAEHAAEKEKARLALAQQHAEALAVAGAAKEEEHRERMEQTLAQLHAEHRVALSQQLAAAEREHGSTLRAHLGQTEEQHALTLAQQAEAKDAAHCRRLEEALAGRDEEHRRMLDAALRQQEAHHLERTAALLAQHEEATSARLNEVLKSKSTDADDHLLKVKGELSEGHREHLRRELAHQREQLRRQHEAEKHELCARLEEKREGDLAALAQQHAKEVDELKEGLDGNYSESRAELEASWAARREEAVKVSARNLHDMHQEALRRALFDKDREHDEAVERLVREKDAHHVEVLAQVAASRDEEAHERLNAELEAMEAEHKALLDQLVKEKLDADKHHRDEVLDLKEQLGQLETKLHLDATSSSLGVRKHEERLSKFCDWVGDQRTQVLVETSLGDHKAAQLQLLDPASGTATVAYDNGSDTEANVSLSRISFAAARTDGFAVSGKGDVGGAELTDLGGVLGKLSTNERTLMVFLPLAVFPTVVIALSAVLSTLYSPGL